MKAVLTLISGLLLLSCKKEAVSSNTYHLLQNKWKRINLVKRFRTSNNFISSWDTLWTTDTYFDFQKDGKYIMTMPGFTYTNDYKIISDTSFILYTTLLRTPDAPADTSFIRQLTTTSLVLYTRRIYDNAGGWSMDEAIDSLSR